MRVQVFLVLKPLTQIISKQRGARLKGASVGPLFKGNAPARAAKRYDWRTVDA